MGARWNEGLCAAKGGGELLGGGIVEGRFELGEIVILFFLDVLEEVAHEFLESGFELGSGRLHGLEFDELLLDLEEVSVEKKHLVRGTCPMMLFTVLFSHPDTLLSKVGLEGRVDNQFLCNRVPRKLKRVSINSAPKVLILLRTDLPNELILPSRLLIVGLSLQNVLMILLYLGVVVLEGIRDERHSES